MAMTVVTQTVTETATATASPNDSTAAITVTSHLSTTILATLGQTVSITSPSLPPPVAPTTKYTPTYAATSTLTITEIDVFLQNGQGDVYSTWILPYSPPSASAASPSPLAYVVGPRASGWDSWSTGHKVGLIVGVVLAAIVLLGLLLWSRLRRWSFWFAHRWPWSGPVDPTPAPAPAPFPGVSMVQPTMVNGPLMPYGHPQPFHNYGYGPALRGGGEPEQHLRVPYKTWFGRSRRYKVEEDQGTGGIRDQDRGTEHAGEETMPGA